MTNSPSLERLGALLAYANPYVKSALEPSVGVASDFISAENVEKHVQFLKSFSKIEIGAEELLEYVARDTSPIPAPVNREGYTPGYDASYWLSGLGDYLKVVDTARRHGVEGGRVLDFGGSTGRVYRHYAHQSDRWDVWSCDFNMTSVEWVLTNLPPTVKTFLNTYYPTLPFEDNSFDLITAFSVFTHLDETELGWLLELRRILKPGGCAYLTLHDEHTWRLKPENLFKTIVRNRPDLLEMVEMPPGKTVVNFREDSPYRCNVFHSPDYLRSVWGRFVRIEEVIPLGHNIQSVVIVRK